MSVKSLLNYCITSKHSLFCNPGFLSNNSLTEIFALTACSQFEICVLREARVWRLPTAVCKIAVLCLKKKNTSLFRNERE
jgi:hypothetical protein